MASKQDHIIKMKSSESDTIIRTFKNRKQNPDKLEKKAYDKKVRKHVLFKEVKK